MAGGLVTSDSIDANRRRIDTIMSVWESYRDLLVGVYYMINDTRFIDAYGGSPLILSENPWLTYLPATYGGTVQAPQEAAFIAADEVSDNLWFTGGEANDVSLADLIAQEYDNTLVKYADDEPYHVYVIGIVKAGVTLSDDQKDELSDSFDLWVFHFGTWRDAGAIKENRTF